MNILVYPDSRYCTIHIHTCKWILFFKSNVWTCTKPVSTHSCTCTQVPTLVPVPGYPFQCSYPYPGTYPFGTKSWYPYHTHTQIWYPNLYRILILVPIPGYFWYPTTTLSIIELNTCSVFAHYTTRVCVVLAHTIIWMLNAEVVDMEKALISCEVTTKVLLKREIRLTFTSKLRLFGASAK